MKKILITAPVHQNIKVFKEYLWSLNRLIIPEGYEVHKYFYLHNADNLKKFLHWMPQPVTLNGLPWT